MSDSDKDVDYAGVVYQLQERQVKIEANQEKMREELVEGKVMFNDISNHMAQQVKESAEAKIQRDRIEEQTIKTNGQVRGFKDWKTTVVDWQTTIQEDLGKLMKAKVLVTTATTGFWVKY